MKLLRSTWVAAILALILGLGTQFLVFSMRISKREKLAEEEKQAAAARPREFVDWSFVTPEIETLRQELKSRLEAVASKEKELQEYETRLRAERGELDKVRKDIERMRGEVAGTITEVEAGEQKNLKTLANTYSTMTPTAALAIFQKMDDDAVVKILAFMKPDRVGPILEEMSRTKDGDTTLAGRAATISNKIRLLHQGKTGKTS